MNVGEKFYSMEYGVFNLPENAYHANGKVIILV